MFRFSIRELMLVTLMVAVAVCWFMDRFMMKSEIDGLKAKLMPLEEEHRIAENAKAAMASGLTQQLKNLRDRMEKMEGFSDNEHPLIPGLYQPKDREK